MQIPESCGSTASGRAAPSLGMPGQEGWHPNASCATEASFPDTGTAGVPTEGLGFISEPGEVRGVWAWGWLLSLLILVFLWLGAAQMLLARAEGSSPASLALLSPHPRLFQDHRSIPHHTALSKVVSLPWLLSSLSCEPGMLGVSPEVPREQTRAGGCFSVEGQDVEVAEGGGVSQWNPSPGISAPGCGIPAEDVFSCPRMLLRSWCW